MLYFIYISILALNFILFLLKRKSNFLIFISIILLIILFAGNTNNPDHVGYLNIFNNPQISQIGFATIINFLKLLGVTSFNQFLFIIIPISYIMVFSILFKFNMNKHFVLFSYMATIFFIDVIQVRNYVGFLFFLLAILTLIGHKKINILFYVLLVTIAGLIHNLFFIFLPVIFLKDKERLLGYFGIIVFSLNLIFMVLFGRSYMVEFLSTIEFIELKSYFWIEMRLGFLLYWFIGILAYFLTRLNYLFFKKTHISDNSPEKKKHEYFLKAIFLLNVYVIIFFPLLTIDSTFYRILRNLYLINISSSAIVIFAVSNRHKKSIQKTYLLTFVYILVWIIIEVLLNFDYIVRPILENNRIF